MNIKLIVTDWVSVDGKYCGRGFAGSLGGPCLRSSYVMVYKPWSSKPKITTTSMMFVA